MMPWDRLTRRYDIKSLERSYRLALKSSSPIERNKHGIRRILDKDKVRVLVDSITLENMDSTVHHWTDWAVGFSEVTIDHRGLYKYIISSRG